MESAIAKYNRKRGVLKTSVHLFRYAFATKWASAGGGREKLQKILRTLFLENDRPLYRHFGNKFKTGL